MPKLNATHLAERLKVAIEQLEHGEEVEAKKNKTLLNTEQQKKLKDAWNKQLELRDKHKPPKTEEEKIKIGWKEKRDVRIEIYKQAFAEFKENIFDIQLKQLAKEQMKATKAYMVGYMNAKGMQDKESAGRIAVRRAGFTPNSSIESLRDKEVRKMEEALVKQLEDEMTDEEREQYKFAKQHERHIKKKIK
jgi:hypothetical protein